jgi:rieske iron-sulfur protein
MRVTAAETQAASPERRSILTPALGVGVGLPVARLVDAQDTGPRTVKCPCHFSEFDLEASARVLNAPAPRRLPALPLRIADGLPIVAGVFIGRPGFESGGG